MYVEIVKSASVPLAYLDARLSLWELFSNDDSYRWHKVASNAKGRVS